MSTDEHYIIRPLSSRESQIVAWLEEERPNLIRAQDLAETFGLSNTVASDVLRRMAVKGWLQRVAQGAYQPLLAESGGIALPNPWAALASWVVPYYVSYGSAAYELGLTPDRPGAVQACVRFGTRTPRRFEDLPIILVPQRQFSAQGTEVTDVHGQPVRMATVQRLLIDSAIRPARVGGAIALARIIDRAANQADWQQVVDLATLHPLGSAGARRIAAVLTLLGRTIPAPLARYARTNLPKSPMTLDSISIYGRSGQLLPEWGVVANVPAEVLREELRR